MSPARQGCSWHSGPGPRSAGAPRVAGDRTMCPPPRQLSGRPLPPPGCGQEVTDGSELARVGCQRGNLGTRDVLCGWGNRGAERDGVLPRQGPPFESSVWSPSPSGHWQSHQGRHKRDIVRNGGLGGLESRGRSGFLPGVVAHGVIPVVGRLRQEDPREFEGSLKYKKSKKQFQILELGA